MRNSFHDLETYSTTPITHGAHRYAETAEVMLWAYALEDGPVSVWDLTKSWFMPDDLAAMLDDAGTLVWFHNGGNFDFVVLDKTFAGFANRVPMARRRDTLVQAHCHGLPGSLAVLGEALGLGKDKQKGTTGRSLIHLFCKPQNDRFFKKFGSHRATVQTHPVEWAEFVAYAGQDIEAMREVHRQVPMWNYKGKEVDLWHLDLKINSRGAFVDQDLARAAVRAAKTSLDDLAEQVSEATDGEVTSATRRDVMLKHILEAHNIRLPDMKKATLEKCVSDQSLPQAVRDLLVIRLQASMNSASKYTALLNGVSSDGRLRGLAQFRGASRTGRWAHRMFQPGNLMRPPVPIIAKWHGIPAEKIKDHHIDEYINTGIEAMLRGAEDMTHGNVRALAGAAVRGSIIAPPGKKLVIADLANIEGRVAAWLTGERWKLQAFRDYDKGVGPDLYKLAYAKSFNVDPKDVNKEQRQIGKVQELMFQYQGGVGAWITGAAAYGIDLAAMTEAVWNVLPTTTKEEARSFMEWMYAKNGQTEESKLSTRYGLSEKVFITCDAIKRLWRAAHPETSSYWKELENTVKAAIISPRVTMACRKLKVRRDGAWLRIGLPSGRALCYFSPRIEGGQIVFMGISPYTHKWGKVYTSGGKLFENVVQAVAADQLGECLPLSEAAGYETVFTVHDENVTETPDTKDYTHERLACIMCSNLDWNEGLPLAAAGFETKRYFKG